MGFIKILAVWLLVLTQCLKKIIHGTKRRTGKVVSIFSFFSGVGGHDGG